MAQDVIKENGPQQGAPVWRLRPDFRCKKSSLFLSSAEVPCGMESYLPRRDLEGYMWLLVKADVVLEISTNENLKLFGEKGDRSIFDSLQCEKCKEKFMYRSTWSNHRVRCIEGPDGMNKFRKFTCGFCSSSFLARDHLRWKTFSKE